MRSHGPLAIQISIPNIVTPALKFFKTQEFLVNTAPKAGQSWSIESVYFNFPSAFKSVAGAVSEFVEFEFEISMFIGSLEVASQKFLELGERLEAENSFHVQGALEPFAPTVVSPGENVTFKITVATTNTLSNMGSGEAGKIVMSYSLNSR